MESFIKLFSTLPPVLHVLANCLSSTSETYQPLLNQPESYHCAEAGHSLRVLSERYAQIVIAAIKYSSGLEDELEEWDDEGDMPEEEDVE
ncbi:conserved hypothetical protein [Candidatus Methylobacter favarea]|uniref:Uncharacterized protein n=2 Tax=Candidatus Methylobacter favarea TaxID=2707345 RepID=A0A8S0X2J7_9GAMM|nr:conserved hypothetical protein [Candidatus Methylobacter favarea]